MAVALRLTRKGTKDRPYYRIIAIDKRKRRDGAFLEQLGTYDPLQEGVNYTIDLEKADKWLKVGAQASETVASIIRKARSGNIAPTPKKEKTKAAVTEEPRANVEQAETVEKPEADSEQADA